MLIRVFPALQVKACRGERVSRFGCRVAREVCSRSGMSLVEVLVATVLFGILAMATGGSVLMSRRMAETNLYSVTAHDIAQGYAEQIMAMDFDGDIAASVINNSLPLTLKSVTPSLTNESSTVDDYLYFGGDTTNEKMIMIDLKGDGDEQRQVEMPMRFTLQANDLNTGSNPYQAYEIRIDYEYQTPAGRGQRWVSGSVCLVKSVIPIY
ncbi:type IV pilus modification PilV family protein [Cerasicoccus maritimus]|uniref:type IV pilus modification PilV family protein n=1 Tax=Cerasicoccus maritimus TaxID=490089 RepID=UPI002852D707|nr:type II secretion system protein [Cerasicoccus maritimus]